MSNYAEQVKTILDNPQFVNTEKGVIKLPCMNTMLVDINDIIANDYNPNHVAKTEMELLLTSITLNGFTYATTCVYDEESDKFIIVDGYHRYFVFKYCLKAKQMPIVLTVLSADERMYATVQFNRARGVHSIDSMGDLVGSLQRSGATEAEMCEKLGMKAEEIKRLLNVVGIAELFGSREYSKEMVVVEDDE